jgi:hypothetical protein
MSSPIVTRRTGASLYVGLVRRQKLVPPQGHAYQRQACRHGYRNDGDSWGAAKTPSLNHKVGLEDHKCCDGD